MTPNKHGEMWRTRKMTDNLMLRTESDLYLTAFVLGSFAMRWVSHGSEVQALKTHRSASGIHSSADASTRDELKYYCTFTLP